MGNFSKKNILISFLCFIIALTTFNFEKGVKVSAAENSPSVYFKVNKNPCVLGEDFNIDINAKNLTSLYGASIDLKFDNSLFNIYDVTLGGIINSNDVYFKKVINNETGMLSITLTYMGNVSGATIFDNTIFTIKAKALKIGQANFTVSANSSNNLVLNQANIKLADNNSNPIGVTTSGFNVAITKPIPLTSGRYEESDSNIIFNGNWIQDSNPSYSGGGVKYSETPGNSIEFSFIGTGFKWVQPVNSYRGISKVTIDGREQYVDNYSSNEENLKNVFSKLDLDLGYHSVKIEVTSNKNQSSYAYNQAFDYIEILNRSGSEPLTSGKYEENISNIQFNGNWLKDSNSAYSGGEVLYSTTYGDSINFTFIGTGFKWVQPVNSYRGIANVIIDGVSYSADAYSVNEVLKKEMFSKTDLKLGYHSVRIEVTPNKNQYSYGYNQAFDYIEILNNDTSTLTVGKFEEDNSKIKFNGNWLSDSNKSYSGGSVKYSETPGDSIDFTFIGTGFKWVQPVNSYRGISRITIDGISQNIDNYSLNEQLQKESFIKVGLPFGIHTVKIETTSMKNSYSKGYNQAFDYVEIMNDYLLNPLEVGKYEENNANIRFSGDWKKDTKSSYSGGTVLYSGNAGDYVEFLFNGTGFKWVQPVNSYRGISKITVDGIKQNVDTYSVNEVLQEASFTKTGLKQGVHKVIIEVTANKNPQSNGINQAFDYIEVLNSNEQDILSPGKYEQNNSNIKYNGTWLKDFNQLYSGGSVLYSTTPGDSIEFTFKGTGFKWVQPVNAYRGIAKVTIDGVAQNIDNYSTNDVLQKKVFSKLNLVEGTHKVKLEVTEDRNPQSFGINQALDYLEILSGNDSSILTVGKYEENNANIVFGGNWKKDTNPLYSGGNVLYSSTPGDSIEFAFNGTGFKWVQPVNSYRGIAKITIDGVTQNIDTYSVNEVLQKIVFSKADLALGIHEVKIELTSNKNISSNGRNQAFDYLEILNGNDTSILTAGKYEENNINIGFNGNWKKDTNTSYSNGNVLYSSTPGDSIEFTFNGTGFKWVQPVNSYRGIAKVTIDGVEEYTDSYSLNEVLQKLVLTKSGLIKGRHKVKIEVTSTKNSLSKGYNQAFDYIEIID